MVCYVFQFFLWNFFIPDMVGKTMSCGEENYELRLLSHRFSKEKTTFYDEQNDVLKIKRYETKLHRFHQYVSD